MGKFIADGPGLQQSKVLMKEEGNAGDGEGELATEWLDKVKGC